MRQETYDIISYFGITSENDLPYEAKRELALSYLKEDSIDYALGFNDDDLCENLIADIESQAQSDLINYFIDKIISFYKSDIDMAIYDYRDEIYNEEFFVNADKHGIVDSYNKFENRGVLFTGLSEG